jgi:hypothetical protein
MAVVDNPYENAHLLEINSTTEEILTVNSIEGLSVGVQAQSATGVNPYNE